MPETVAPEVSETVAIEVPLREGEEKFRAGMNLEDARRRESRVADLQEQLRALGQDSAASEVVARTKAGRAERERQRIIRAKVRELQTSGQCHPATVVNLNPVGLDLSGELISYGVPASGKGLQINLDFRGRRFVGSYVTIATPKIYLRTTGSTSDPTGDRPTFEAKHIPPIGIAHQFYLHYCSGAASGQRMGGILTFEGDIHTLVKAQKAGKPIRAPRGEWVPDLPGEVGYVCHERTIEEYLGAELAQQRAYAELVIAQGHSYYSSQADEERRQLSNRHVVWHDYALRMGYIKTGLPWATEKLSDNPLREAVFCPDCRTRQEDPEQYFCRNCNSPFDAFKAFMAGRQVSPDKLAMYAEDSKEWKEIIAEMDRRRKRIAMLTGEVVETKKPKA
jgi:hypothetical protein